MANAQIKVSLTNELTGADSADLLYVVDTSAGANGGKHITVSNFLGNSSANLAVQIITPANSTITVRAGTMFVDTDYLYIAVSDNTLKRVALSTF